MLAAYAARRFSDFLLPRPRRTVYARNYRIGWRVQPVGAQREHRYHVLVAQAKEKGLSLEPIQFYLDFFKYGCPPHGGFGAGLSRMLMVVLNQPNIREVTFLFRGPTRLHP
ncbi:MAG: hypothetical protein HYT96_03605 [Armatimonadetes bacterium]|nr:hypothetical protein [Armatimonadota bacterium]